ncbi:hypothetical protein B7494_g6152 [Chlorociboria aeruginascens]|nr:hypothetical protein B7494_g6152 [Chlorociboria aeruginascens]
MPPLILHNVPDDELYTGDDGIQRPYAVLFPSSDGNAGGSRSRRGIPETGSFGKSTRRSRSRTATPAAKREDPTIAAGEAIFSSYVSQLAAAIPDSPKRKNSLPSSASQPNLSGALATIDGNGGTPSRYVHKEPTEVILRGFKSSQQYAAIGEYERIAGRICEDYPRDPPLEQRRYKSDLRDQASLRRRALTPAEKAKALKFAGGEHWIKVTFESAEAADAAVESSPQTIHGHLVSAELYRGVPPSYDEAIPALGPQHIPRGDRTPRNRRPSALPRSQTTPAMSQIRRGQNSSSSPVESTASSHTLDSATISTATLTGEFQTPPPQPQDDHCQHIRTARKIKFRSADMALLPRRSLIQRILSYIPLIGWFSTDLIGSSIPKTEDGEFDWGKATLYWKFMWWLDSMFGGFDLVKDDKED